MKAINRFCAAALLLAAAPTTAEENALTRIMSDLADHLCHLNRAIFSEDFTAVVRHAEAIAENPQPPFLEKMRLLATLGTAVPEFKAANETVQTAANGVVAAAELGDLAGVRSAVAEMEAGCVECHSAYRRKVTAARNAEE